MLRGKPRWRRAHDGRGHAAAPVNAAATIGLPTETDYAAGASGAGTRVRRRHGRVGARGQAGALPRCRTNLLLSGAAPGQGGAFSATSGMACSEWGDLFTMRRQQGGLSWSWRNRHGARVLRQRRALDCAVALPPLSTEPADYEQCGLQDGTPHGEFIGNTLSRVKLYPSFGTLLK